MKLAQVLGEFKPQDYDVRVKDIEVSFRSHLDSGGMDWEDVKGFKEANKLSWYQRVGLNILGKYQSRSAIYDASVRILSDENSP